ncbi:MAG: site-specific DNA-methyltransferase [Candidatus Marinimicrobia bacterium]|jgi:DNA modification methylase|nr:site-specific DNA-methyltransferase [Candidatus Neomarinimicrobiota bacterium]|tara:strand:+ start:341 stop:1177 length:837 start_codon:yes stop_codon:yes gene_type:complete
MSIEQNEPLFTNPLEAVRGLTINDLNKYLPAVQKVEDISMTADQIKDGVFLGLCLDGLKKIPDSSIDLIIADPPESPWRSINQRGNPMTIQEYFQWNENWLKESARILKPTGAIYLISGWRFSGMYHSLLNTDFHIQTRITWRNSTPKDQTKPLTWINRISDIWFATKSNEFMFNQEAVTEGSSQMNPESAIEMGVTNLWSDIMDIQVGSTVKMEGDKPEQLIQRILTASSFKLNWVVDPFTRSGGVGVIAKKMGRRFIGFESDQDQLLMAMKRIDKE